MKTNITLLSLLLALACALVCAGCSLSHGDPPGPVPDPDVGAPDAGASDASLADAGASEATLVDAGASDASLDALLDCVPPLVADAELCVGWRAVAAPPCEAQGLVRIGERLGIVCGCGTATYVLEDDAWWPAPWPDDFVSAPTITSRPDTVFADALVLAELPDGSVVAPHGDVYAHPAAWRTDREGRWRETLPPPSAFVVFGAALSDDEALFVGRDAYVFVRSRR